MQISLALHIIGVVFWIGGLLIISRFSKIFVDQGLASEGLKQVLNKSWWLYIIHGLALTLITGVYQLVIGGMAVYMKQGWFHTKLTFILLLGVATILQGLQIARINRGELASAVALRWVQILTSVGFIVIVVITKAMRF